LNTKYLIPRLNYKFGVNDFFYSLYGIVKSDLNTCFLNSLFDTEHIYFTNHARTGLRLLLNSMELPPNARIGVQAYNCHTVFNAIKIAGFQPVFIDINSDFRINVEDLDKKKENIDVLILTHTFGIPADIDAVKRVIPDVPIIEDCAHSFLSKYNDQLLGKFGDAAIFSIAKGKFPSIGNEGGFVVINNNNIVRPFNYLFEKLPRTGLLDEFSDILKSVLLHFLHNPFVYAVFTNNILRRFNDRKDFTGSFTHREKKILECNLYLLSRKQKHFESYLAKQKKNLSVLQTAIKSQKNLNISMVESLSSNGFMFPVLTKDPFKILTEFKMHGIELGRHFSKSIEWAKNFGYVKGTCPNAENIAGTILAFPCHYNYDHIEKIKKIISDYEGTD
jgi:perosamine synthetase